VWHVLMFESNWLVFVDLVGSRVMRRVLMSQSNRPRLLGPLYSVRLLAPGARCCGSKLVDEESELPLVRCVEASNDGAPQSSALCADVWV
jgi:hypothetical protein